MSKKRKGGARRRKQQHARQPDSGASLQVAEPDIENLSDEAVDSRADPPTLQDGNGSAPPERQQQAVELGYQLRQAREQQGLDLDEAAHRMRLPWRVVDKLESGDWRGIDSPVYLQGYLRSYTQLLGLEIPELVEELSQQASTPAPLVSSGGISHTRYLAQRYAVAGTYLVITALIVVPILILGFNGSNSQRVAQIASLDPVSASSVQGADSPAGDAGVESGLPPAASDDSGSPLMASMAPVNLIEAGGKSAQKSPPAAAAGNASVAADSHASGHLDGALTISLSAPSWVEVTSASGKRVEYALLDSGEHKYSGQSPLTVRLGNAGAANVRMDGQALDLSAYKRANVAYFRVDSRGTLHAPSNN